MTVDWRNVSVHAKSGKFNFQVWAKDAEVRAVGRHYPAPSRFGRKHVGKKKKPTVWG